MGKTFTIEWLFDRSKPNGAIVSFQDAEFYKKVISNPEFKAKGKDLQRSLNAEFGENRRIGLVANRYKKLANFIFDFQPGLDGESVAGEQNNNIFFLYNLRLYLTCIIVSLCRLIIF